jgi:8-oxo-dGTP diphosphatase
VEQALRRELQEEIGVTIARAEPWRVEVFDYPHARVRLHFCRVREWTGRFEMREGQQMSWERLPVRRSMATTPRSPVTRAATAASSSAWRTGPGWAPSRC